MRSEVTGTFSTRFRFAMLVLVAFALVASLPAFSQGIATGSISGYVADPTGAMVPSAKVTATNTGTNLALTTTTNNVGYWTVKAAPTGIYRVTIETPNFQKLEIANVQVAVAKETALGTSKLSLSSGTEVVEVHEAAPLMETTTSQVTTNFGTKQLSELPLAGGFDALTLFIPGIADAGDNNFSNTNGAGFSSNGLRGRSNNFQIDGQSNNDNSVAGPSIFMANEDAIQEVNVVTNNFGVEYGRNSGSVVNYVTKSGTNTLHGSVFEANTNSLFDAHTNNERSTIFGFCPPGVATGTVIPETGGPCSQPDHPSKYIDNRYGGSLGGPIIRNKAWFFGSYLEEKTRAAGSPSTSGSAITPTPAGIATLAAAYPNNAAVKALQTIGPYAVTTGGPSPIGTHQSLSVSDGVTTTPGVDFAPITRNVPSVYNDWELVGKTDLQLTGKDRLSVRYIFQKNNNTGATGRFAAGAWVDIPAKDQQIALDWVRTISNTIVNQARFSYSRAGFGFEGGSFPACTRSNILGCPTGIQPGPTSSQVPFGIQNNLPQGRLINNSQWQDNASWVRGRHTFKFGGEYDRQRSPNTFLPNINGTYSFGSFNAFLANTVSTLSLTDGPKGFNFKEQDAALYFGDDWRIKDNLTLNLGLRWEYSTQAVNLLSAITRANQARSVPVWDPTLPTSVTTLPDVPAKKTYFAPNVGFAWTPKGWFIGDGKTVFRGGARIAYDPAYYNIFLNIASAAPVVNAGNITGAGCSAPCLPIGGTYTGAAIRAAHLVQLPTGGNPGLANRTTVSPDFHEPRTYLWSFGLEREITSKIALESRYVGNRVNSNFFTLNANPRLDGLASLGFSSFIPSGVTQCATSTLSNGTAAPGFSQGRADCNFRNVRERINGAWSYYHGWQNQLRISGWHGVTAGVSYTFSKTIDNNSEIFSTGEGGTTVASAQNPFNISAGEKGESGISFPHVASIYLLYEFPFFKSQKGFLAHLLGGYGVNTTWRYSSGQLSTPGQFAFNLAQGGITNDACQNTFDQAFFGSISTCRPFSGNPSAPIDAVGICTNAAAADCGLVDLNTYLPTFNIDGDPVAAAAAATPTTNNAVRYIVNNNEAARFFGTPYGNVSRSPHFRGQTINNANLVLYKSTKIAERVTMRLEAQVYNVLNRQFRGSIDPFYEDFNLANQGSFGNNYFNNNGGDYTAATIPGGIGRRRMILGAKFTF